MKLVITEAKLRSIVKNAIIIERMASKVYKLVMTDLNRNGPMNHNQLMRSIISVYPMLTDDQVDNFIDSFEEDGQIIYNRNIQKYH